MKKQVRDKTWFIIAYDVKNPSRLRKVSKHLEGYGYRIQYSIFRCRLSKRQIARLKWELAQIIDSEDSILITPVCATCFNQLETMGILEKWESQEGLTYFLF